MWVLGVPLGPRPLSSLLCLPRAGHHGRPTLRRHPRIAVSAFDSSQQSIPGEGQHARQVADELTFVKADTLHQNEADVDRLARYLETMEECVRYHEEHSTNVENADKYLVVSQERTLSAMPASYLQKLTTLLRNAKYNIKPMISLKHFARMPEKRNAEGRGDEIMLQGFNWDSSRHNHGWWDILKSQVDEIADYGFSLIWLPPPTASVSSEGYMPTDLYDLNSQYGSVDELRELISMFHDRGVKVLGDTVLNHRCAEHQNEQGIYNQYGGALAWDERAIVCNDPNFRGKGNLASGEMFDAAPNIDHSQGFVKSDLGEWLVWLRTHIGFDGFRLDFAKGFHGSHWKDYLEVSKPDFAVGEYWGTMNYSYGKLDRNQDSHRQRVVDWIQEAGSLSCAFDMTTKGILHAVFEESDYSRLAHWDHARGKFQPSGLLGFWPSRTVTFVSNHDTDSSQRHWPFPDHALEQGYAYILTHPGTPCVFYDHVFHESNLKHVIRRLIAHRRDAGIDARSEVDIWHHDTDRYVARITRYEADGTEGDARTIRGALVVKLGPRDFSPDASKYEIIDKGHNWAIWRKILSEETSDDRDGEDEEDEDFSS
jgi:alpha-amylase